MTIKWQYSLFKRRIPNVNKCKHFSSVLKLLYRGIIYHSTFHSGDISLATSTMKAGWRKRVFEPFVHYKYIYLILLFSGISFSILQPLHLYLMSWKSEPLRFNFPKEEQTSSFWWERGMEEGPGLSSCRLSSGFSIIALDLVSSDFWNRMT